MSPPQERIIGRAAQQNPANRFESVVFEEDLSSFESTTADNTPRRIRTQYIPDDSQTIISENNSPDLNFRYSLNAYRGCEHGCSYCYARTYHEYLGYSAGLDFETKILYKPNAANLFRDWLNRKSYECEPVNFAGATDCYQPVEHEFELTRQCLQVAVACNQPITIVTKNAMVLRDLDLLKQLAAKQLIQVNISITSLDQHLIRIMEPRTSYPQARLRAIRELSQSGIPVRALLSPIVPGLNDVEIPKLVQSVADAGANAVRSTVVRLPGAVQTVFFDWLSESLPQKASVVESRIRNIRSGSLHDVSFGTRMTGTGELARQIHNTCRVFAKKCGVDEELPALDNTLFRRPRDAKQGRLF